MVNFMLLTFCCSKKNLKNHYPLSKCSSPRDTKQLNVKVSLLSDSWSWGSQGRNVKKPALSATAERSQQPQQPGSSEGKDWLRTCLLWFCQVCGGGDCDCGRNSNSWPMVSLLSTRHCIQCFSFVFSFNPLSHPMGWALLLSAYCHEENRLREVK